MKRTPWGSGKYHKSIVPKPRALYHIRRTWGRYGIPETKAREELTAAGPFDVILISSSMTYWYEGTRAAIKLCRELFPEATILIGGIYPTLCKEHASSQMGADNVITGEGLTPSQILDRSLTSIPDPLKLGFPVDAYHQKLWPS